MHYQSMMREKTLQYMQRHPSTSPSVILAWLRHADEATRRTGLELVRTPPKHTVGEALRAAKAEHSNEWNIPLMASGAAPARGATQSTAMVAVGQSQTHASPPQGLLSPVKNQNPTCKRSKGRWLCEDWNLGKCSTPCPQRMTHACDVRMETGAACAFTGHSRQNHK